MYDAAGRHEAESHDAQVFSSHQWDVNPTVAVLVPPYYAANACGIWPARVTATESTSASISAPAS